ncbi:unnamed protein product [Pleuronectes platessa]|uniref:Uncharacterized protein n=1 Tax=Pleuronectes platessa TaxID=8262 RepID=A0A9N7TKC2_PLEPL|nr:unnamed protein product [Pleuronectes platessa]
MRNRDARSRSSSSSASSSFSSEHCAASSRRSAAGDRTEVEGTERLFRKLCQSASGGNEPGRRSRSFQDKH